MGGMTAPVIVVWMLPCMDGQGLDAVCHGRGLSHTANL